MEKETVDKSMIGEDGKKKAMKHLIFQVVKKQWDVL